ncbi:acyltransferase family protein [Phytoactinopolyspora alkaliphila]|uniref:acyltransferase family protein n=1 Tax=Phytoactinopolyspora alkaliphila TaxID=1783498 RepID=UPI001C20940D
MAPAVPARTAPITPRDSFIDVLRVFAIVTVVALHWLMPALSYDDGLLSTGNTLAAPGAWAVTWVAQVMPLVFFAGGAAAMFSIRDRRGTSWHHRWRATRLRRLVWPVLPLIMVWLPLPHLLLAMGVPADPVDTASRLAGRLLWFLALYILLTALTPVLVRAHRRWRGREILAMAAGAVAVDVVRFGVLDGADYVGFLNVVAVWGTVYQLGIAYAAGSLPWLRGRRAAALAGLGLVTVALAVVAGPYPASMIGMPGEPVSNMNPPTAVLLAVSALQLGLAFALRPAVERWAAQPPVATGLAWLSARLMTIYLWHMPALAVVGGVAVVVLGWQTPDLLSAGWRTQIPIWLAALTTVLAGLVRLFGPLEHPKRSASSPGRRRSLLATVLIGLGLLSLTVSGFSPELTFHPAGPVAAGLVLALGLALVGVAPPTNVQLTGSPQRQPREKVEA